VRAATVISWRRLDSRKYGSWLPAAEAAADVDGDVDHCVLSATRRHTPVG